MGSQSLDSFFGARDDLSHYDLQKTFTANEAACLIVGIDPHAHTPRKLAEAAPVLVIQRAITAAYQRAVDLGWDLIGTKPTPQNDFIISDQLLWSVSRGFLGGAEALHELGEPVFSRSTLRHWLLHNNYRKANYFLPDEPVANQEGVTAYQAQIVGLQQEISQLKAENQRLKQQLESSLEGPVSKQGLSFRYETDLLRLVAEVQDRYLSETYDPSDFDTRPSKNQVVEWLEKQKGITAVTASAVDRVAMPFNRNKKRL